ncbi:MAG: pirin family protein [Nitrosomonas sp.]|nr:pirin family protein [Nitrosomonas sp.]
MNAQATTRFIPAMTLPEGAGVTVHRTIGTPALQNYDPFLLLDYIDSNNPEDYSAGFPAHPHRGFSTLTYIIDGEMEHTDSMGNTGVLGPGSAQWMKAASGIIHSEMPRQHDGLLRGFQLWINLPASNKMDVPEYQEYTSAAFPVLEEADYRIKVISGQLSHAQSPIVDNITDVSFLDVQIKPSRQFQYALPEAHAGFLYIFEGDGQINGKTAARHTLVTLDNTDAFPVFTAGKQGARLVLISGRPIHEPIARHGPFVMNTRAEIDQAMQDFQSNSFVRDRAWMHRKKPGT